MDVVVPGQRWVSDTEPELGLGTVVSAEGGRLAIRFAAAGELRHYAFESAPLRRARFREGDRVAARGGAEFAVERVEEAGGLLVYEGGGHRVLESELSDRIGFASPESRLLAGHLDPPGAFELRARALEWRARLARSPARGFAGARIELVPHQLSIAEEVGSRLAPRALLADEVGLGKTIEACLVLHRLHVAGRADRVLVLVPEPLVHQWFVELLRRFNLRFSLFDEDRCRAIESGDPGANPFLDEQLVLAPVGWAASDAGRGRQLVDAGWDLLIVDEAHHLEWDRGAAGPSYRLVRELGTRVPGLLLLTATPGGLESEDHFARLRLLDPGRYPDFESYREETQRFGQVAKLVAPIVGGGRPDPGALRAAGIDSGTVRDLALRLAGGEEGARVPLVEAILDEFGPGRAVFRNTRETVPGFPRREVRLVPLEADPCEGDDDAGAATVGARVRWLTGLLGEIDPAKVLVICRSAEIAGEISERLRRASGVRIGLFHEGLSLIQRDRAAAFFAEDDGARVLISSEIGSEGRNFQFAHHLVLFDLPHDPELLEQRIGRLDRIGQRETVRIHVPFVRGSRDEVLATWYHDGLQAFEKPVHGAAEIARAVADRLGAVLAEGGDPAGVEALVRESNAVRETVRARLAEGADRLLAWHSLHDERARERIESIQAWDGDVAFEGFVIDLLEALGVRVEPIATRTVFLRPDHLGAGDLPGLAAEGFSGTFDRARALAREDLAFLTADHPLVHDAIDFVIARPEGNATLGMRVGCRTRGLVLECLFVVECVAPPALHVDRFLPATPVRVAVDHEGQLRPEIGEAAVAPEGFSAFLEKPAFRRRLFPAMLERAEQEASRRLGAMAAQAVDEADRRIGGEIDRLEDLRARGGDVTSAEVAALDRHRREVVEALRAARWRLDAVRVVVEETVP